MQPSERNRQLNKDRFDSLSIPGNVIKKDQSRGPRHGPSLRQTLYHEARVMLRKAKLPKNGHCHTILERWYKDAKCRADLSEHGSTEEQNRQYDALALVDRSYEAAFGERRRWEKSWHIVPMRQRPDFREAKQAQRQPYKEHAESTGEGINPIHPAHQARQNYRQQFSGSEEYNYTVHPRTGWKYYPSTSSSSSSQWQHDDWKSNQSLDCWRSSTWTEQ